MPSEIIEIRVVTRGAAEAGKDIEAIGQSARRSASAVGFLSTTLKGILGVQLIRAVASISDGFTNLSNRVAVFARNSAEAQTGVRGLVDIALRSRQSLEAAGTVFQRFSIAGREAGLAQKEILAFTETLLKATTISGATAQEAEGALRQLLQGFAANKLSGQELNSVLEQTPVIAALIAKQLGVGVGQLRVLANKSKDVAIITREVLIKALREGAAEIEAAFARTNVTFGQAVTNAKTAATVFIGEMGRVGSVIGVLPRAISAISLAFVKLAQNAFVVRAAAAALNAVVTLLALRSIPLLISNLARGALSLIAFVRAANPITLVITALVAAFTFLGDTTLPGLNTTLFDIVAVLGGDLIRAIAKAAKAVLDFFSFDPENSTLGKYLAKIADFLPEDVIRRAQARTAARNKENAGFGGQPAKDINIETAAMRRLRDLFEDFQSAQRGVAAGLNPFDKALADILKDTTDLNQRFDDLIGHFGITKQKVDDLTKAYNENRKQEFVRQIEDAAASFDPLLAATLEYQRNLEKIKQIQDANPLGPAGPTIKFNVAQAQVEAAKSFELAYLEALAKVSTGFDAFLTGAALGVAQFRASLGTEAENIAGFFNSAFGGALDALNTFFTTGKNGFRDFAISAISELEKVILKILLIKALNAASSAAAGAGYTGIAGALIGLVAGGGKARGGPVRGNRTYMVGERGPELYTPPATGNIVPTDQLGGAAGAANVTVVNVLDQAEVARMVGSSEGEKAILNVINRNRGRVRQSIGG